MGAYLYILKSKKGRYYVGSTTDLERRYKQHTSGHTPTTKRFGSLKLVFHKEFNSLTEARKTEKKIKSWKRRDFIEKIISDGRIKFIS